MLVFWLVVYVSDMASDRAQTQNRRLLLQERVRILGRTPLMRGSLVERLRRCGKPNCACARDPEARHGGKFLTIQLDGRTHAVHVRPEDEPRIQEALDAYQRLWSTINELTACELADLHRAARERRQARRRRAG